MARSKLTAVKPTPSAKPKSKVKPAVIPTGSKQDQVIGMLKRADGATIADLVAKTGWQKHTVRALISASLRKRLQLDVISEKNKAGKRIYRIAG